jgi:hypothetical protein
MKLKWLDKILVELPNIKLDENIATLHGNLLVFTFFMYTDGWVNGASLTGTP